MLDLDEHVRLLALLAVAEPAALRMGQRLRIDWQRTDSAAMGLVFSPEP